MPEEKQGRILQATETDQEVLARAGLLAASVACADLSSEAVPPKSMDRYSVSAITLGHLHCKAYMGRILRYNNVLNPRRHTIRWIYSDSPLMVLAIDEAHKRLQCGLGPEAYASSVRLAGFSGVGLISRIKDKLNDCETCSLAKLVMTQKSPVSKLLASERGPDDFVMNCLSQDVMQYIVIDEAGPFFLTSQKQK